MTVHFKEYNSTQLQYWATYGITKEVLDKFKVRPIIEYQTKSGKTISVRESLAFGYVINDNAIKLYQPLCSDFKFSWLGNKPSDYIFGYKQLDKTMNHVTITSGEKDVMCLNALGYNSICLNSETANLSQDIYDKLIKEYETIYILYDNDDTGKKQSQKLKNQFNQVILVSLPQSVKSIEYGKDVSDLVSKVDNKVAIQTLDNLYSLAYQNSLKDDYKSEHIAQSIEDKNLELIFKTQKIIAEKKSKPISFADPILEHTENPIIFPRTINVIQGKAGVHKSRLAQIISSILIKQDKTPDHPIGFQKPNKENYTVIYVDTERNWTDQFPYALQNLQKMAGYKIQDNPPNFDFISLLDIKRTERLETLRKYIEISRRKNSKNLIIVLDVLTDCLKSFNDASESMELIDILNSTINNHDVTFICVIHENPGVGSKARGHLGTEIMNKASTVLQCSVDKNDPNKLIKIDFLKCRSSAPHSPIYSKYDFDKGLVLAQEHEIKGAQDSKLKAAPAFDIAVFIIKMLKVPIKKSEVMKAVKEEFSIQNTVFETRTKEIISSKMEVTIDCGEFYIEKYQEGKYSYFRRVGC